MMGWIGRSLVISSVVGLVFSSNCTAATAQESQPNSRPTAQVFTLQTPIDQIAADPRGKAVLNRDLPGMLSDPNYDMFSRMNLAQLASLSGGKLSRATLKQVSADLAALKAGQ